MMVFMEDQSEQMVLLFDYMHALYVLMIESNYCTNQAELPSLARMEAILKELEDILGLFFGFWEDQDIEFNYFDYGINNFMQIGKDAYAAIKIYCQISTYLCFCFSNLYLMSAQTFSKIDRYGFIFTVFEIIYVIGRIQAIGLPLGYNFRDISSMLQKKALKIKKQLFISSSKTKNIKDDYEYVRELGSGGYGVVFLAQHRITGERRAVKTISKQNVMDKEMFATEVQLLKKLDHPNIIKLFEVYQTEKTIYLVTEVCEGGELFYLIVEKKFITQAQTAIIMRQIFSAIAYLHHHNICHRDLKPENILLKEKDNIQSIKLIDFGIAKIFKEKEFENQPKGTTMYLAPEVINGKYGKEVDNWACGVILYILLCGRPPFYGKDVTAILMSIKKGIYTLDREPFHKCSNEAKDLIAKLLVKDPAKRYTALKAYEHPWVKRETTKTTEDLNLPEEVFKGLKKLVTMKDLKKTILMYLAVQISEKQIQDLRKIFVKLDVNGNGMISKQEMMIGLEYLRKQVNANLNNSDIEQIFNAMDFDNSGQVDYTEFIASFLDATITKNQRFLRKEFEKLDADRDGKLNKNDIENLIHSDTISLGKVDVQKMIDEADLDGDGKIDYGEFLVLLRQRTRTFFKVV